MPLYEPAFLIRAARQKKGDAHRRRPICEVVVEYFYATLRRRRSHPSPTSPLPRSVSDAGSGTGTSLGTISPAEKVPEIELPAVWAARLVRVCVTLTVKSISAFDPAGKSPVKVGSPLLLPTVKKAFTSNCGEVVLSLMSGQVTVPLIMSESVVDMKEKVSVPPDVIGK